jgi:hypothetical protein
MNTGQMLLAAGGLILLATIFLTVNRTYANSSDLLVSTKLDVLAVSLATSIVEEATSKAFDAITVGNSVHTLDSLTSPHLLGPLSTEVYPNYNDFDDYNGLELVDSTTIDQVKFSIKCTVTYVDENDPSKISYTPTWHKRITVEISNKFMVNEVKLSTVQSYFFFR